MNYSKAFQSISLCAHNSSLEGAMELKFVHSVPLEVPFPMASFFAGIKLFRFWPKTMDYSKVFLCALITSHWKALRS